MAGAHESMEQTEHVEHAAGHNKGIALLIAVLALFLAFSETFGKSAQTEALSLNIRASDTWNFFQAKTIRQTTLRTAAENLAVQTAVIPDETAKAAAAKQVENWRNTVTRYESDPKEKDGRKELRELAERYEHERDLSLARYHNYEFASASFQIAIVLASATIITGMIILAWAAGALGVVGIGFMALGLFAPTLLHFSH
jgi:lipopolysaccharide export LptBFGC system permease protein LptF